METIELERREDRHHIITIEAEVTDRQVILRQITHEKITGYNAVRSFTLDNRHISTLAKLISHQAKEGA